jgi:hypothetical protein
MLESKTPKKLTGNSRGYGNQVISDVLGLGYAEYLPQNHVLDCVAAGTKHNK